MEKNIKHPIKRWALDDEDRLIKSKGSSQVDEYGGMLYIHRQPILSSCMHARANGATHRLDIDPKRCVCTLHLLFLLKRDNLGI